MIGIEAADFDVTVFKHHLFDSHSDIRFPKVIFIAIALYAIQDVTQFSVKEVIQYLLGAILSLEPLGHLVELFCYLFFHNCSEFP